jgi:uncharacterized membrane protein YdjX (TVP38/TMEM64 family)
VGAVIYTALGGPRQVLAFSCGFLLGGWQGGLLGTLLTGCGAMLTMLAVHKIGFAWVRQKHAQKIEWIKAVLAEDTWIWICVIRLIPVGSNLVTNMAAALSDLRPAAVFFGSLLGYLPQMLLFSYAGSGVALHDSSQLWISLALLVLSTGLGLYLYHHGFKQRLNQYRHTPAPLAAALPQGRAASGTVASVPPLPRVGIAPDVNRSDTYDL